jgi:glycosyltransferase involved in cell wall biosynthesis
MNIVILGHFVYPSGSAQASRIRHFAKGFIRHGHQVSVITTIPFCKNDNIPNHTWLKDEKVSYCHVSKHEKVLSSKQFLVEILRSQSKAIDVLADLNSERPIDVVMIYSNWYVGMQKISSYCKKNGILTLREVNEWFDSRSFRHGVLNPFYWDRELCVKCGVPKADGIIAISSYLEEYYKKKNNKVVRIPAIIDVEGFAKGIPRSVVKNDCFHLTYLGSLVWRDGPLLMLKAVESVLQQGEKMFLNIVGTDGQSGDALEAYKYVENRTSLKKHVKFWGRVSDEQVLERLSASDALLFTRLPSRAAKAAFPTRLPEYLATGTPVISSDVSDIANYLDRDKDIVLVKSGQLDSLTNGILKLIWLPDRGKRIGISGREKCKEYFDYFSRSQEILNFIERLKNENK